MLLIFNINTIISNKIHEYNIIILIGIKNKSVEINKIFIIRLFNKRILIHNLFYQNSPFSGILLNNSI